MEVKQKLVKRASVMALAAAVGCGIFGCQKKTEPIIPEVSVRVEETLDNDGDTIREVESVMGKENSTKQYQQKQLKKGESLDGKITGRTRIENGVVMEWQEEFPMDKSITPVKIDYATADKNKIMYYEVNGVTINVEISDNSDRWFCTGDKPSNTSRFATVGAKSKSNEQVLKSVAAADAIEKAMKAMTK